MPTQNIPAEQASEVTEALERLSLVLARAFLSAPPPVPARKSKARSANRAKRRSGKEGDDSAAINPN